MFMTLQEFKSPMSDRSTAADMQLWQRVGLVFQKQWVMLSIRHLQIDSDGDDDDDYFETIFLSNFNSYFSNKLIVKNENLFQFVSGYIFIPVNEDSWETFDWSMEAVAKVWLAESDDDPGPTIEVCETKLGNRYIVTRFLDQNIRLKNLKLIFEF